MNWVDPVFAFTEGLALIVSPCILPVLPLVLGSSIDGGKARPLGVITGFVVFFSLLAYGANALIDTLGIDTQWLRWLSLILLGAFGLVLLIPALSHAFERATVPVANLGSRLQRFGGGRGFLGGFLIGAPIGLVWTPCAGPMLAAVLVQVSTQTSDLTSFITFIAFAAGAGVPMLAIALTGRRYLSKLGFLTKHSETVKRVLGALLLGGVLLVGSGVDPQTWFSDENVGSTKDFEGLVNTVPAYPAPPFTGIERWFNSKPLTMAKLKGKVVLVDFWTYSCINCVRTIPFLKRLDERYRSYGLQIVGVHSPEFAFEKYPGNVERAIKRFGIGYPVALDNKLQTWTRFENRFWPAQYLINQDGRVIYTHFGEGDEDITENNIRRLLGIVGKKVPEGEGQDFSKPQTPETYLGHLRAERFTSNEKPILDHNGEYSYPAFLPSDRWALSGQWKILPEKSVSRSPDAGLRINFTAKKVFVVLGTEQSRPTRVRILLNGEPVGEGAAGADVKDGAILVRHHTLYEIVSQPESKNALLEIVAEQPGVEAYAFTFGS